MSTTTRTLLFILITLTLTGCGAHKSYTETLSPPPAHNPRQPVFLDVDIFRGSITITENPALTQIQIKRSFHALQNNLEQMQANIKFDPPLSESLEYISYHASFTDRYRNTRQPAWIITATSAYPLPEYQWVNLDIHVPTLAGLNIRTSHGNVTVNNTPAPMSIGNDHGNITVKTNYTITHDIQLITTHGNIELSIPLGSTGSVDIDALNGEARFSIPLIQELTRPTQSHISTSLKPGRNQIILRTTNGKARVIITGPKR